MQSFYLSIWDHHKHLLLAKLQAPKVPEPGEDVAIDFDSPTTEVIGGNWMAMESLKGRFNYTITKPEMPRSDINGLPIVECQLANEF